MAGTGGRWIVAVSIACAALVVAAGCSGSTTTVETPVVTGAPTAAASGAATGAGLSDDALGAATYVMPDGSQVTLTGGEYSEPAMPGSATMVKHVVLVEDLTARGDLNGDGVPDAAVILMDVPGGSGVFMYLAAVVDEGGNPKNVSTVELGDRTQVNSNTITGGTIALDVVAHAPEDPMCCPTEHRAWTFALQDGQLARTDDQLLGTVTPAAVSALPEALVGTWQWLSTNMNDDTSRAPGDPALYTVTFAADNSVNVKADCNAATGDYEADASGIAIHLGPTTMAACGEDSLSGDFLQDLSAATAWSTEDANLLLDLRYDSGTMRLAPTTSP